MTYTESLRKGDSALSIDHLLCKRFIVIGQMKRFIRASEGGRGKGDDPEVNLKKHEVKTALAAAGGRECNSGRVSPPLYFSLGGIFDQQTHRLF